MVSGRSQTLPAPLSSTPCGATRGCGVAPALPGLGVTGSPWEAERKGERLVTLGLGGTARCCSRSRREGEEAALCQQPRRLQAFVGRHRAGVDPTGKQLRGLRSPGSRTSPFCLISFVPLLLLLLLQVRDVRAGTLCAAARRSRLKSRVRAGTGKGSGVRGARGCWITQGVLCCCPAASSDGGPVLTACIVRPDPAAGKERAAEGEYCGSTHVPTGAAAPSGPRARAEETGITAEAKARGGKRVRVTNVIRGITGEDLPRQIRPSALQGQAADSGSGQYGLHQGKGKKPPVARGCAGQ